MILYLWSFGVHTENSLCEIPHYPVIRMLCAQSLVGDETLVARVLGAVGSAGVRFLKVFKFNQRLFTHFLSLLLLLMHNDTQNRQPLEASQTFKLHN